MNDFMLFIFAGLILAIIIGITHSRGYNKGYGDHLDLMEKKQDEKLVKEREADFRLKAGLAYDIAIETRNALESGGYIKYDARRLKWIPSKEKSK